MKTQYRIAKKGNNFFPQVRTKTFIFWGPWKTIGIHIVELMKYHNMDKKSPIMLEVAKQAIIAHSKWIEKRKPKTEYIQVEIPKG